VISVLPVLQVKTWELFFENSDIFCPLFFSNKRVLKSIKEITEKSEDSRASANRPYGTSYLI